jgi:hypothetical protein
VMLQHADADVVRVQYARYARPRDWRVISASGSIEDTVARVRAELRVADTSLNQA